MTAPEYEVHLQTYANHGDMYFSTMLSASDWGDQKAAELYLRKFWLSSEEYEKKWKPIQNKIFFGQERLPEIVFDEKYEIIALRGGCLFVEDDFSKLQQCLTEMGDRYFVVIENTFGGLEKPAFQMKYPTSITWEELKSGNFISAMILGSSYKEFFVFGESAAWGKYSAADYTMPLDLIGFQRRHSTLFREKFRVSEQEWREVYSWLPSKYQKLIAPC